MKSTSAFIVVLAVIGAFAFGQNGDHSGTKSGGPWFTDFGKATAQAKKTGRLMMVDFNATWCGPCQMYKSDVFPKRPFKQATEDVILVNIDIDKNQSLARKFGVNSIPDIRFLTPDGKEIGSVVGYAGTDGLLAELAKAKKKLKK